MKIRTDFALTLPRELLKCFVVNAVLNAKRFRSSRGSVSAFTLIEVLIALFIIAIALSAVTLSVNHSIRATTHVQNTVTAHLVAMNIMSDMQTNVITTPADGDSVSGETAMLGKEWQWHVVATAESNEITKIIVIIYLKNKKITSAVGYKRITDNG